MRLPHKSPVGKLYKNHIRRRESYTWPIWRKNESPSLSQARCHRVAHLEPPGQWLDGISWHCIDCILIKPRKTSPKLTQVRLKWIGGDAVGLGKTGDKLIQILNLEWKRVPSCNPRDAARELLIRIFEIKAILCYKGTRQSCFQMLLTFLSYEGLLTTLFVYL